MNKNEIYEMLNNRKIWYEVTEHKAVYNMEELDSIDLPYKDCDAKNLFVRDDNGMEFLKLQTVHQTYRYILFCRLPHK